VYLGEEPNLLLFRELFLFESPEWTRQRA
jgi:hypothetical protein